MTLYVVKEENREEFDCILWCVQALSVEQADSGCDVSLCVFQFSCGGEAALYANTSSETFGDKNRSSVQRQDQVGFPSCYHH